MSLHEALSGAGRIHVESVGNGIPVVFIHAGVADSQMWDPQFAAVPDGFRFVRPDLQGFGKTRFAGGAYSDHGDVLAVMDHLCLELAVIVGCSMGGGVALDVSLTAPQRVAGLCLIGTNSPGFEPPGGYYEPAQWEEMEAAYKAGDIAGAARLEAEMWVVGVDRAKTEVEESIIALVAEMDRTPLSTEADRERMRTALDPPRSERMEEIDSPTLVVVGRHDFPDLRESAVDLAGRLSHRDAVVIDGAGHLASLERPSLFNPIFYDFLRTIDS